MLHISKTILIRFSLMVQMYKMIIPPSIFFFLHFLDRAPTPICHLFRLSVPPSICSSVCPSVYHVPYLRNPTSSNHNFWYTCVKWYLQEFFSFFEILIFRAVRGVKGQEIAQNEKISYIRHVPYLRNSKAYNHDFWYTCVKWWYL